MQVNFLMKCYISLMLLEELLAKREDLESRLQKKIDRMERQRLKQEISHIDHQIDELETENAQPKSVAPKPDPVSTSLQLFQSYLKEGAEIPQKRRGFLTFLFSRHPKVLLGEKIAYAAREARTLLKSEQPPALKDLLSRFLSESEKSWNNSLYEGKVTLFYEELALILKKSEA